ncbi:MAG: A/G-specific adenine glycosylase [Gemmatimonadota bacterium]|nr:A/G-specific adenine glycosylase [Gemmatimonadota bacterium]
MPSSVPANSLSFKRRLLKWFRAVGRDLPWRRTRDPYRVIVSEFMLQQTQVSRVVDFYARFVRRFPTVEALARARPHRVREAWQGLGYYRRAAHLHQLARTVVDEHDGDIPSRPELLTTLPGVGRYTAGAVANFAYERRVPAVDTNVARVLSRAFGRVRGGRRGSTAAAGRQNGRLGQHAIWDLAARILPTRARTAWEFNQALMDLGATVCTARNPKCSHCPVQPACRMGRRRR